MIDNEFEKRGDNLTQLEKVVTFLNERVSALRKISKGDNHDRKVRLEEVRRVLGFIEGFTVSDAQAIATYESSFKAEKLEAGRVAEQLQDFSVEKIDLITRELIQAEEYELLTEVRDFLGLKKV